MAPSPDLSPAGSSSYSSNTMTVGDGTWDSTKNDFLLPNLVGLNFETMQYNGMGNRFASLPQYHVLILGHGVLAAITFLFILPIAIMYARFYGKIPGRGVKIHIYLNIMVVFLTTTIFILGNFAVGPNRSLTNPHHGIGTAIFVLVLIQALGGRWVRGRLQKHPPRRPPIKLMLHQWIGRATALLGIIQVALGLTLYGSPKFTFVLYTLWMTFLLILYFILSYRAAGVMDTARYSRTGTTVIEEKKSSGGLGKLLAPLAAGAGLAALFKLNRDRKERREERDEVVGSRRSSRRDSRRDSGSYSESEKESEHGKGGGIMGKLLGAAAVLGAGALAKRWWDSRKKNTDEEAYESVDPDSPSHRRRSRDDDTYMSRSRVESRRVDHGRRPEGILPGPGDPVATAAAISAAEALPVTPRPVRHGRRDSYDSYSSTPGSVRRREEDSHGLRNFVLAGMGLGWLGKKYKDRKDRQEQQRVDEMRTHDIEEERRLRRGNAPRFTGDGTPSRRPSGRRPTAIPESDLSSETNSRFEVRPSGLMPPLPAGVVPGIASATVLAAASRSPHEISDPVPIPFGPPRDAEYLSHNPAYVNDSGSEAYVSAGGTNHRRHSSRRGREAAAAAAVTAGAALAAAEVERRRRDQSHSAYGADSVPAASVKMKMHGDPKGNVTVRLLTEEEAAAQREARRRSSRRRADSVSSLSATDEAPGRRPYRRDDRRRTDAELLAENRAEAGADLSPPRPAFAGGRQPKDSAYYSGPGRAGTRTGPPESLGSPESHGTWSGMSPSSAAGPADESANERRRRRRAERNQRQATGAGTVDFS